MLETTFSLPIRVLAATKTSAGRGGGAAGRMRAGSEETPPTEAHSPEETFSMDPQGRKASIGEDQRPTQVFFCSCWHFWASSNLHHPQPFWETPPFHHCGLVWRTMFGWRKAVVGHRWRGPQQNSHPCWRPVNATGSWVGDRKVLVPQCPMSVLVECVAHSLQFMMPYLDMPARPPLQFGRATLGRSCGERWARAIAWTTRGTATPSWGGRRAIRKWLDHCRCGYVSHNAADRRAIDHPRYRRRIGGGLDHRQSAPGTATLLRWGPERRIALPRNRKRGREKLDLWLSSHDSPAEGRKGKWHLDSSPMEGARIDGPSAKEGFSGVEAAVFQGRWALAGGDWCDAPWRMKVAPLDANQTPGCEGGRRRLGTVKYGLPPVYAGKGHGPGS